MSNQNNSHARTLCVTAVRHARAVLAPLVELWIRDNDVIGDWHEFAGTAEAVADFDRYSVDALEYRTPSPELRAWLAVSRGLCLEPPSFATIPIGAVFTMRDRPGYTFLKVEAAYYVWGWDDSYPFEYAWRNADRYHVSPQYRHTLRCDVRYVMKVKDRAA